MRQGKASAKPDGVVTYVEGFESPDNEAYGNLYNHHSVAEMYGVKEMNNE